MKDQSVRESAKNKEKESARVELFSDGVFAIAITLLVLELIQILHPKTGVGIIETCLHHWQSFVAFFIGFITILICWINHHVAFEFIHKVDTKFMWVNGFLLFIVTLTPFPTAILAEYLQTESTVALAIFGFNYILISIAAYGICSYAYNHYLIRDESRDFFRSYKRIYLYAIYYNILVFFICFISTWIAICFYIILFSAFAAPKELTARLEKVRLRKKAKLKDKKIEQPGESTDV
ncbi:MAG: TMEM175 family protein [Ferruginibacter sp.]